MGDRANLTLKYHDDSEVNVYVHWLGADLPQILAKALNRRKRWNDETYLARIIISAVLNEAGITDETGAGIAAKNYFGEGGPVVDLVNNTVTLSGHWGGDASSQWSKKVPDGIYTFDDYIEAVAGVDIWDDVEDD